MSDRNPWWFSGDEDTPTSQEQAVPPDGGSSQTAQDDGTAPAMDWLALVSGAKRMVDWAAEAVMAPHAEHEDPRDYPQCVVCRTLVVLGDVGLRGDAEAHDDPAGGADGEDVEADVIAWIPIREPQDGSPNRNP